MHGNAMLPLSNNTTNRSYGILCSLQSWLWVLLGQSLLVHAVQKLSELFRGLRTLELESDDIC